MLTGNFDVSPEEREQIKLAKQEWEHTFDAVSDLIFITDATHTIVRANRAMAELCGMAPQELAGRKCFDLMHDVLSAPDGCPHKKLLESGKPQTAECYAAKFDCTFEVTLSPVFDTAGEIAAAVCVARDVTEKKRNAVLLAAHQKELEDINSSLESRINAAVAELRKKDDLLIQQSRLTAMGEMINSIAHHWRQPLNSIGLIVQNLQLAYKANDLTVEELDADIADTMRVLQQISETIDDFRSFFNREKTPSSFSVNDAVSRSINFVMPSLKSSGIKIVCDEQSDISVFGYPNEYAQALLNIIVNAKDALLDSRVERPLISIRISAENGRSLVSILDNGGGINDDVMQNIFDPYFTTKGQGKGAGIGLYMSKMIIEKNMTGRLSARNVNGGAEFRIEI